MPRISNWPCERHCPWPPSIVDYDRRPGASVSLWSRSEARVLSVRRAFCMIFPSICLATAFVMSTWFVENLAVARTCGSVVHGGVARRHYCGCTVSVGAPRRSRELLRRRCTHCRHCCGPRCCSTSCDSTTRSIPTHLSPGCAQATTRGVPVTVGGQLVDSFGAKVLCSRQPV